MESFTAALPTTQVRFTDDVLITISVATKITVHQNVQKYLGPSNLDPYTALGYLVDKLWPLTRSTINPSLGEIQPNQSGRGPGLSVLFWDISSFAGTELAQGHSRWLEARCFWQSALHHFFFCLCQILILWITPRTNSQGGGRLEINISRLKARSVLLWRSLTVRFSILPYCCKTLNDSTCGSWPRLKTPVKVAAITCSSSGSSALFS